MTIETVQESGQTLSRTDTLGSLSFPKSHRLLKPSDFSCVFDDAPVRASNNHFLILARPSQSPHPRLGLVIAKKNVRKACQRNRIKRIARETFRLQQHKLAPIDAIVLARRGADANSAAELHKIFNGLWKRINKRARSNIG